jgi:hypothetical protein
MVGGKIAVSLTNKGIQEIWHLPGSINLFPGIYKKCYVEIIILKKSWHT